MSGITKSSQKKVYQLLVYLSGLFALSISADARGQCPSCKAKAEVKQSRMEQGEAKIGVQSNLRISIKGEGATGRQRVEAISESLRAKTTRLKECYARVVNRDPSKTGSLKAAIKFAESKPKPTVEIGPKVIFTSDMLRCVREVLTSISIPPKHRPASALVTLQFTNSRAQGQQAMQTHAVQSASEPVVTNSEGKLEYRWSAPNGKVSFTTKAEPSQPHETLVIALRAFRQKLGAFLDCRRIAARRGASPEGETIVDLSWSGHNPNVRFRSSSLPKARAVTCVKKVLRRLSLEDIPHPGQVTTTITFSE